MVPSHIQQENVAKLASLIVSWRSRPAFWSSSIKQQTWLTILFVGFLDLRNLRLPPCWSILNITKLRQLKEKSYKVQKTVFFISWYQPRNHIERAIIFNVSFMDSLFVRKNDVEWNNRDYKLDERSTIESSDFPSIINDRVDGIKPIEFTHQLQMFVQLTPTEMVTHEGALCIRYTSRQE